MKKSIILLILILVSACSLPGTGPDPILSVSLTPATLTPDTRVAIHVRVENAGNIGWESNQLTISYGLVNAGEYIVTTAEALLAPPYAP